MTEDEQKSLTDVAALMRERQKFEAWLAALEARRGSTPEHVFERVRGDYEARLDRVMSDLLSHRDALAERVRDLGERLAALESSERQRRDQRAEMDLRAAVGELVEDDYAQAAREVESAIARATAERGEVQTALEQTNELLLAVTMPRAMSPISAAPAVPAPAATQPAAGAKQVSVEDEPARITAARHAATHAVTAARDAVALPPAPAAPAPPAAPLAQASVPRPRPSAPVRLEDIARAEPAAAAAAPPSAPTRHGEPPVDGALRTTHPPMDGEPRDAEGMNRPPTQSSAFDELAFLNSIVGEERRSAARAVPPMTAPPQPPARPSGPGPNELGIMRDDSVGADSLRASRATGMMPDMTGIVQEENVSSSLVSRGDLPHDETEEVGEPLASNVTGNHPIVLRPAGDVAQHKTLRCNECGAMNYPTEWYCERCGAELAAL